MNWLFSILRNGKTIVGAILTLAASVGAVLTPDDLALIQAILAGTNTAGQITLALGLLHKLWKAVNGQPQIQPRF